MKLRELLTAVQSEITLIGDLPCHPALDREITSLSTNSWACQPGSLFIGMPGTRVDGGNFWASAISAGAVAALVSAAVPLPDPAEACVIPVQDVSRACGAIAAALYNYPTQRLKLVGVTGTNGKTTTTHLIEYLLNQTGQPTALLGTLYTRWPGYQETAVHTTPFAVELQGQLASAVKAGCPFAVMEVSSHALAQGRVQGCTFQVGVFTNLTQDHLDFHKDLEDYFSAKALLFSPGYLSGKAIINQDDPYGQRLIQQLEPAQVWTYSTSDSTADFYTRDLNYLANGVEGILHTPEGEIAFTSPLVGQFNVANLLAAVGAALSLGVNLTTIAAALPQFSGVPGRMQQVQVAPSQDISVIVDYAHTPDSLENMLRAARPFVKHRMICVFGCGGDRDRTKRPKMGGIAAQLADQVVVTSDNPRTEDPQRILEDILTGVPDGVNLIVEGDRRKAIQTAILNAQPGDSVLIAGKGHEDYQILGTEKVHFDDREEAQAALQQRLALSS
uniref:UDP-N-acetylmuramoyl-L-alanyl-D-glutamate--2,6-diaminopimelate ligase n=1 Tax=Cyanothece sp. (strain PCC 7425 / ATCC 29141) TaxID=395961 RepID=B8HUW1_CYAP4